MSGRSGFHNDYKKSQAVINIIRTGNMGSINRDIKRKKAEEQARFRVGIWNETCEIVKLVTDEQINILISRNMDSQQIIEKLKSDKEFFKEVRDEVRASVKRKVDENQEKSFITSDKDITEGMIIGAYKQYVKTMDATKIAIIKNMSRQTDKKQDEKDTTYPEENR